MKTTTTIIGVMLALSFFGQEADQNPNFRNSQEKYAAKKDMAGKEQSITQQETYEVTDWREEKAENKEERKNSRQERRHELRKLRIERDIQNRRFYNNNWNRRNRWNNHPYPYNNGF